MPWRHGSNNPLSASVWRYACRRWEKFEGPVSGREAAQKLLQLRQDTLSVTDYAVEFCMLAVEGTWNSEALFDTFLHGLLEEVKDELAARGLQQVSTHSSF